MEIAGDISLMLSSLDEYLDVVKQQPHSLTQDEDSRLKGYIDVMKLLAQRATHNTYTLEEGARVERERALDNSLRESSSSMKLMQMRARGVSELFDACGRGSVDVVKALLAIGVDAQSTDSMPSVL
eukprot:GHVR01181258.1.p1 GENE.GHVR01181258.1~~GHVR01181258.1.p1  ORF type:complete len:126 (+),score=28.00 GHVR01181258.1:113-490(+)